MGTSFNIKTLRPNDWYTLTTSNFICEATSGSVASSGGDSYGGTPAAVASYANYKNYNNGILTAYTTVTALVAAAVANPPRGTARGNVHTYLILWGK